MGSIVNVSAKLLTLLFALALIGAIGWNYATFFVNRDYVVYSEIACDPTIDSCFSWVCTEGDTECDDSPYKKIELRASSLPLCDGYTSEDCPEPACAPKDEECVVTYCQVETRAPGEVCVESDNAAPLEENDAAEAVKEIE